MTGVVGRGGGTYVDCGIFRSLVEGPFVRFFVMGALRLRLSMDLVEWRGQRGEGSDLLP